MNPIFLLSRILGLFLSLGMALPSSAWAMRSEQAVNSASLEEQLAQALSPPAPPFSGLEEISEEAAALVERIQTEEDQRERVNLLYQFVRENIEPNLSADHRKLAVFIPLLARWLKEDSDPDIRETAGWALNRIELPEAVEPLMIALGAQGKERIESKPEIRSFLLSYLSAHRFSTREEDLMGRVIDLMRQLSKEEGDSDAEVRKRAGQVLGEIEPIFEDAKLVWNPDLPLEQRKAALGKLEDILSLDETSKIWGSYKLKRDLYGWVLREAWEKERQTNTEFAASLGAVIWEWLLDKNNVKAVSGPDREAFLAKAGAIRDNLSGRYKAAFISWIKQIRSPSVESKKAESSGLEEAQARRLAVELWSGVVVTPAYEEKSRKRLVAFAGLESFSAIPLVARGRLPFLVFAESGLEEIRVRSILSDLNVDPDRYQIRLKGGRDFPRILAGLEEEFPGREILAVDSSQPNWFQELLAGLEEAGVIPLDDLTPASQATEYYFKFV